MPGELNVCGVLVHAHPDRIDAVEAGCAAIPGVETHGRGERGRVIVTIEDTEAMKASEALAQLNKVPGVIAAALVYHEFDPGEGAPDFATESER